MFYARPQSFISKPLNKERIIEVFKNMLELYEDKEQDFFVYQIGRERYRIALKDIIYFCIQNRTIYIKTVSAEDSFYGTIKDVKDKIKNANFFMANRSYLVNYRYVSSFVTDQVFLVINEVIPLGVKKYKELIKIQKKIGSHYNVDQS